MNTPGNTEYDLFLNTMSVGSEEAALWRLQAGGGVHAPPSHLPAINARVHDHMFTAAHPSLLTHTHTLPTFYS